MLPLIRISSMLFFLLIGTLTKAATFVVTSRANAGTGTLRDAIIKANANGTTSIDYIHFNLPGTTIAARTITLAEELPALSSNIEIDGSTQPGAAFGVSGAKVRLLKENYYSNGGFYNILSVKNAENVSIYGLHLDFQGNSPGSYCLSLSKSNNINIGAAGKGNVLNAADVLICSDVQWELGNTTGIRIAYNLLGMTPDGLTPVIYPNSFPRIILWGAGDVEIHHNVMCAEVRIEENYMALVEIGKRNYKIYNNIGGGDYTGTRTVGYATFSIGVYPQIDIKGDNLIEVKNNHILQGYFFLGGGYGNIVIQGNKINTDRTGTVKSGNVFSEAAISIYRTDKALIGGDLASEKNYISGGAAGISCSYYEHVTIKKNSIFCNTGRGIQSAETVFIKTFSNTKVTGTSEPDALIEVFEADKCSPGADCQGKVYIGSTTADANGQWTYTGTLPGNVVVTGTNKEGATSEFTRATINIDQLIITHVLCGKPGSIKGIKVTGAALVQWEDETGNVISNEADLLSVPPGKYTLKASTNNNPDDQCATAWIPLTVLDIVPKVTTEQVQIVNPCNDSYGSISNMTDHTPTLTTAYKWLNEKDEVVGTSSILDRVPAGTYRLFAYCTDDCFAVSDPVVLTNQTPPTINATAMVVTNATCENSDGAINGINVTGTTPYTFRWLNTQGSVLGSELNLRNTPPGIYQLELTDNSGCRAITSDPVEIAGTGSIRLDAANVMTSPAGCNGQGGVIKGILITGADTYTWRNPSGEVVGNAINLTNAAAGSYQLTATNSVACITQSEWYSIATAPPVYWSVSESVRFPTCNEPDGEISIKTIQGADIKALKWTNDITGEVLGNDRILRNVGPGKYAFYITDQNGCEQLAHTREIPQRTLPVLTGTPAINDETCGMSNGSITAQGISGEAPFTWSWTDNNGSIAGTATGLKNLRAGTYFLQVTDKFGCKVNANAYAVNNVSADIKAPEDVHLTIAKGQSVEVKSAYTSPAIFTLYSDAALNQKLFENNTGIFMLPPLFADTKYYLTAKINICTSAPATINIKVIDKTEAYMPTAFSPNGDGLNDIFKPRYLGIASIEYFKVYNRWGVEVFSTKTLGAGWDGKGMDIGSYFYVISGKDLLGKPFIKRGSVLLIR